MTSQPLVDSTKYPQLCLLLWDNITKKLTEEEALYYYETKSAWVDFAAMDRAEHDFLNDLITRFGRGVFLG